MGLTHHVTEEDKIRQCDKQDQHKWMNKVLFKDPDK